jgi:hypothetical protein
MHPAALRLPALIASLCDPNHIRRKYLPDCGMGLSDLAALLSAGLAFGAGFAETARFGAST